MGSPFPFLPCLWHWTERIKNTSHQKETVLILQLIFQPLQRNWVIMEGLSRAEQKLKSSFGCIPPSLHLLTILPNSPYVETLAFRGRANFIHFLPKEAECHHDQELGIIRTQLYHTDIAEGKWGWWKDHVEACMMFFMQRFVIWSVINE